jgi:hypothetical protein
MVDLIEIAKPLTRLKSIRQNQEPAGALAGAGKTCIEPMRDEFPSKMPGIPETPQESSRAASCYRLSVFRRMVGTSGGAWQRRISRQRAQIFHSNSPPLEKRLCARQFSGSFVPVWHPTVGWVV